MSRSYRKPVSIEGSGSNRRRIAKTAANRRVRYSKDVPNGNSYRKLFNPWEICDGKCATWAPPLEDHPFHSFRGITYWSLADQIRNYKREMRK